ncbi:hypothetical protein GW17_00050998, partial [Ensete ventricosum]
MRENWENLNANLFPCPFSIPIRCCPPSTIPFQEVTARRVIKRRIWRCEDQEKRRLEQRKRQPPSSPRLRLYNLLRRVLHRRSETFAAFFAFFAEGRRRLRPLMSSPPSSPNVAHEATRRRGGCDIAEVALEELYQDQGRILGVESSQEEVESRIDKVESLVDRLTEGTKDSVQHLHEVVAELTAKVMLLTRTLNPGGNNTRSAPPQSFRALEPHCYGGARDAKELE